MKKLFFTILLAISYNAYNAYPEFKLNPRHNKIIGNNYWIQHPQYFKYSDNSWNSCIEVNENEADCINIDKYIPILEEVLKLRKDLQDQEKLLSNLKNRYFKDEKAIAKISDKLIETEINERDKYDNMIKNINNEPFKVEKNLSPEEQERHNIKFFTQYPNLKQ